MARDYPDPATRDALKACGLLYGSGLVPALRLHRQYAAARNWAAAKSLLLLTDHAGIGCGAVLTDAPPAGGGWPAPTATSTSSLPWPPRLLNAVT
ncbi:hypothetical protein PR202_gb24157 [Eleusine coracana subsp. coracana]|uniref:Uncharacterized protein n=1 Tax=Eleusine coracana subsp. coracana TaxID=191504 RepID=A0AAV5FM81_ELECO|nr:hypothetical protein PR202_gb24157 [Eleusine coracana subsp. coracana]